MPTCSLFIIKLNVPNPYNLAQESSWKFGGHRIQESLLGCFCPEAIYSTDKNALKMHKPNYHHISIIWGGFGVTVY